MSSNIKKINKLVIIEIIYNNSYFKRATCGRRNSLRLCNMHNLRLINFIADRKMQYAIRKMS